MTTFPFKQNRLSADECEIILLDRKYPPNQPFVASLSLFAGLLVAWAGLQRGRGTAWAIFEGLIAFVGALFISHLIYYLRSSQLGVPTTLLANIDFVKGYVQQPEPLLNFLIESPLQLNWGEVRSTTISHRPWVFATDKVELDLQLRNGTRRTFRLPRLIGSEKQDLAAVLRAIGTQRGFDVVVAAEIEKPRLWHRW